MPPALLGAALDAARRAIADAIEARRVGHRERLQHHRMDQREDGGRAADPEGQRENRRRREEAGGRELFKGVTQLSNECHAALDGIARGSVGA
jgi:hypothetical protein